VVLALGLTVVLASPAFAQRRGQGQGQGGRGPGGPGGGIAGLLQNESVQKELKFDKEEADKVKDAVQKVRDKHADEFAKLRDMPQEERRQKSQELNKTVSDETLAAVSSILKADQMKRLKQIELQQAGVQAFTRPDVQKALTLTDEQKDAIKTIDEEAAKKRQELFQQGGSRRQAGGGQGQSQMATLRKETLERVQKLLTADQKKVWKDLTGDTFEIQRGQGRRQQQQQE
jgi:hypothetical protein